MVGLAVIDSTAGKCLSHYLWNAPAGESSAGQLQELYVRARELFERNAVEVVVLWPTDPSPGGAGRRAPLIEASRAEGAVIAAAGAAASVSQVQKAASATIRAAAGLSSDIGSSVAALCGPVDDLPADEAVVRAAAAAIAWYRRT